MCCKFCRKEDEQQSANNLTVITNSQSKQSLKSLLKSDITRDKSNLSRYISHHALLTQTILMRSLIDY